MRKSKREAICTETMTTKAVPWQRNVPLETYDIIAEFEVFVLSFHPLNCFRPATLFATLLFACSVVYFCSHLRVTNYNTTHPRESLRQLAFLVSTTITRAYVFRGLSQARRMSLFSASLCRLSLLHRPLHLCTFV